MIIVDSLPYLALAYNPGATPQDVQLSADMMRTQMQHSATDSRRMFERRSLRSLISDPDKVELALGWAMTSDPDTSGEAMYEMMITDLRPTLAQITSPVLVVASAPDGPYQKNIPKIYGDQYAGLANKRLVVAEHAKHFVMWDAPAFLYQEADAFLAQHPATVASTSQAEIAPAQPR